MRNIERISVSEADRDRLERLVRDRNTPQKVVWRARIVLLAANGLQAIGIAAAVGKSLLTVRRWRRRYVARGSTIEAQMRNGVADLSLNEAAAMLMLSSDVRKLLSFARRPRACRARSWSTSASPTTSRHP